MHRWILVAILIFTVAIVGGIAFSFNRQTSQALEITNYTSTDQNKPTLVIDKSEVDLGEIALKDTKSTTITIRNTGQAVLQLYDFKTSCSCTSTKLKINNQDSPLFSMHNNPPWTGSIAPGETGSLEIIYVPRLHPVSGPVERNVFFRTNDPQNTDSVVTIKAVVK